MTFKTLPYWKKGAVIGGVLALGVIVFKIAFFVRCGAKAEMLGLCSLIFAFPFGFIVKPVLGFLDYLPTILLRQIFLLGFDVLVLTVISGTVGWLYGILRAEMAKNKQSRK
ncbi:MAG: hypothetical protein HYV68_03705 [Candidatus Taylorbacteria bacterium]|nr:hypothetical protein [Candidatus Taylorbacteria bacterium]